MSKTERRVVLERDMCPKPPYDDGSFPIIYATYRGGAMQVDITSYALPDELISAAGRCIYKPDVFERYARVWFGVRSFAWRDEREGWNVALDPADWREWAGLTDEHMAKYPDIDFTATLGEYGHYLDGDVWVAVSQEKCDHGDWHTIGATGGLYGEEGDPQLQQYADEILGEVDDE